MIETGIILLAAGSSERMGRSKQLLVFQGEGLLRRSVRAALETGSKKVVAVLGAHEDAHRNAIEDLTINIVSNTDWSTGMGSSVKVGLRFLLSIAPETEAVIIMVCDQPLLTADHLKKLFLKFQETKTAIVASAYSNTVGVPALFSRSLFQELLRLEDEQGAKKILLQNKEAVQTVDFPEGAIDMDTPEDYDKLTKQ